MKLPTSTPAGPSALSRILCQCAASALLLAFAPAQAALVLSPLVNATAATGQGLSADWYQVDGAARFSAYDDGTGTPIGAHAWGTGIWAVSTDLPLITAPGSTLVTDRLHTVSAVSFANQTYNDWAAGQLYGTWAMDHARPLAPLLDPTGPQENYAAVFGGYLYIAATGAYDLGVFSDDGFAFRLLGAGQSLAMGLDTLLGSPGRVAYSLADRNGLQPGELVLEAGYYGVELQYFNRLEAGVIELNWQQGAGPWEPVDARFLFAELPAAVAEPGSAALAALALGLAGWFGRRRASASAGPR